VPAGLNTAEDEMHPSVVGNQLAFERVNPAGDTTRILEMDLTTGREADLFNAFEASQLVPSTPSLTSDGATVITGTRLAASRSSILGALQPSWGLTGLASFPSGPFAHSVRTGTTSFTNAGETLHPIERSDGLFASVVHFAGSNKFGILLERPGAAPEFASESEANLLQFALSDATTNVVVINRELHSRTEESLGKLAFRPVVGFAAAASTLLPALVNPQGSDELDPGFTTGGRYLGFVRYARDGDAHLRLFVFDTATQTLLNTSGIDLGVLPSFGCEPVAAAWTQAGNLSLRQTFQLVTSSITFQGVKPLVSFSLSQSSGVGILVQRVVGHHRLFGHLVRKLETVGRVPFGSFKAGSHRLRWNLRVAGRALTHGTYLVTPRLVSGGGIVHELGTPRLLRIN
jgi:hypothetical protein